MTQTPEQLIYTEDLYQIPSRVLVLIPVSWQTLPEEDVTLLTKILTSARLSISGVQILNLQEVSVNDLKIYTPTLILSFGVPIKPAAKRYTVETIDSITIIQSDALSTLNDATKKELWTALKSWLTK